MDEKNREKVRTLIRKQGTCVLATALKNQPYCSLMAYATNDLCDEIYLMTLNKGRKYQNLCENPVVSLLIDTRQGSSNFDPAEAMALTISGRLKGFQRIRKGNISARHCPLNTPGLRRFLKTRKASRLKS